MIWYLLYPLRGTTEPPRLPTSHPIRRAFQAHGTATAQHWLLSIVLTVTISILLCYQAVFQADSSAAAGLRNLPKHVWTSTTKIDGDRPADIVVRQVWIHGDYMHAIDRPVLRQALLVQDALIGTGFDVQQTDTTTIQHMPARDSPGCVSAAAGQDWGFHSPLLYWNCSSSALDEDEDLLATINSQTKRRSALGLTLRPSTVFAGKSFSSTKLRAADALVITMFDQSNPGFGDTWNYRARKLAGSLASNWTIFPEDGHVTQSRLYELRFSSMTLGDDLFLAASYFVTAVYVIWRMMQLRAVKSWFGLLVTICAKMTICIIASFTLCTHLGIDLTRIPRPWFPAVVFCFGLGNIFRLINVVLETPPEMLPHQRIGNALGQVGHLSVAIAFQNLALLYLCAQIVTPWVADFCVFAAVTLVLDLVFHLTFFVAVLSVDVQRMELSDSLSRAEHDITFKKNRAGRQTWLSALKDGSLPLSTRFAGTVAIFSIILAINWHFFDSNDQRLSIDTIRRNLVSRKHKRDLSNTWSPPPINQARTPGDWLRIQDHNTARELFSFIKPGAQSFIARVYDPLLVVSKGAYGRDRPQPPSSLLDGLRRFAQGHAFPAALLLVFAIAGVTLLMNYLLWSGIPDSAGESEDEDTIFSVKTLPVPQALDVVQIASCPKGHVASISLDRTTSIWLHGRRGFLHTTLQTATMKPALWPIYASAMDDGGNLLAMCAETGQIGFWNIAASRFSLFPKVDLQGQSPILFSFVTLPTRTDSEKLYLIIVSPSGHLIELEARTGIHNTRRISSSPIVCATFYNAGRQENSLVFVTKPGEVHILSLEDGSNSTSDVVAGLDPGPPPGSNPAKIKCIQGVPELGLIFALRDEEAEIFDFASRALIHSFQIGHVKPHTFRVMHSIRRTCPCGAPAIRSLSVAYSEEGTKHMILQTFAIDESGTSQICLGKAPDRVRHKCRGLDCAKELVRCVEPAGSWEATGALSVVGVRKRLQSQTPSSTTSGGEGEDYIAHAQLPESALKQRARRESSAADNIQSYHSRFSGRNTPGPAFGDADTWEAWTLSLSGEFRSRPLVPDDADDALEFCEDDLFIAAPGPIMRLGKRSVALGFGNTVKIITLGKEVFDGLLNFETGTMDAGMGSYKWRTRKGSGRKVQ
ncbi:hypothetical protein ACN47E_005119 [Coniothyrium glycines]